MNKKSQEQEDLQYLNVQEKTLKKDEMENNTGGTYSMINHRSLKKTPKIQIIRNYCDTMLTKSL